VQVGDLVNTCKNLSGKLKKELSKVIKHSMQIELFLKATWCPGNPNYSYIGQ
jgi:hypothetical protein